MGRREFWTEVFAIRGSVTPFVQMRVLFFGVVAFVIWSALHMMGVETGLAIAPYEVVGVVLALLLVLRTNSGYDRWYEGRKLWGGIVNQSRNLAILGLEHGPRDKQWRDDFIRWTTSFCHVSRHSLRNERDLSDIAHLFTEEELKQLAAAEHMPSYVASRLARLLRLAVDRGELDRLAFLQAEHERTELIDHIGACERIVKTPLALVFSIKIRRFLFLYMLVLPFALVDKTGLLAPLITMMVAYPLLSLDQIGIELENPFSVHRLSHLPLNDICATIEKNIRGLHEESDLQRASGRPAARTLPAASNHNDVGGLLTKEPAPLYSAAIVARESLPSSEDSLSSSMR